jgi:hypothetical protein
MYTLEEYARLLLGAIRMTQIELRLTYDKSVLAETVMDYKPIEELSLEEVLDLLKELFEWEDLDEDDEILGIKEIKIIENFQYLERENYYFTDNFFSTWKKNIKEMGENLCKQQN